MTQICSFCGEEKSINDFYNRKDKKSGKNNRCKSCNDASYKKWALKNKHKRKNSQLLREFGINISQYNLLKAKQNNRCAICGEFETAIHNISRNVKELSVDHCHKTNKIRGLLCSNCNTAIGKFRDNILILKQAIKYLKNT